MSVGLWLYVRWFRPEWQWDWAIARRLSLLAAVNSANIGISLFALSRLNVPMYQVLKRMNVVLLLLGDMFLGRYASSSIVVAVLVTCAGTLIAGYGDLDFTAGGYGMAMLSCVAQAGYFLLMQTTGQGKNKVSSDTVELLLYNSILSLPLVASISWLSGDLDQVREYKFMHQPGFVIVMILNLFLGAFLNFATWLSTTRTSALTTSVAGQLKSTLGVALGFFIVGGARTSAMNLTGVTINGLGSMLYSYAKWRERSRRQPEEFKNSADLDVDDAENDRNILPTMRPKTASQ